MLVKYLVGHAGPVKVVAPGDILDEPEGLALRLIAAGEAIATTADGKIPDPVSQYPLEAAPQEYQSATVEPAENAAMRTKPLVPRGKKTPKAPPIELSENADGD